MLRREADELLALELGDRLPLVNDSGIGWPCIRASSGLESKRLQVRRPARHVEVDDPLGPGRRGGADGRRRVQRSAAATATASPARSRRRVEQRGQRQRAERRPSNGPGRPGDWMRARISGRARGFHGSRSRRMGQFRVIVSWRLSRRGPPRSRRPARPGRGRRGPGRRRCPAAARAAAGSSPVLPLVLVQEPGQDLDLLGAAAVAPGPGGRRSRAGPSASVPASRDQPGRQDARGLDVGRVVEQDQGLERRVRPRALDGAFLPGRGVEGQQARVEERPLPVGIEAAAILVVARGRRCSRASGS